MNDNVWEDWFDSFKLHFNKICNYKNYEDKRKFLNDYVEKVIIVWNKETNTHHIKIQFKLNIVNDVGELVGKDIYRVKRGKKEIDFNGINVRKFNNYHSKKRDSETYLLTYSTVTLFARLRG